MRTQSIYTILFIFLLLITAALPTGAITYEQLAKFQPQELLSTGNSYLQQNSTDTALVYYIALANRYAPSLASSDKECVVLGYLKAGNIYYEQNIYHTALDFYFRAIRICEDDDIDKTWLPQLYINTGNIYRKFEDYEKAGDCYRKGLCIARETANRETEWKLLVNLVGFSCIAVPDSGIQCARKYHRQAKLVQLASDTLQQYYNLFNEGYIYYREKNCDSAAVYYKKALDFAVRNKMSAMYIASPSSELAFLYEDLEQYNRALEYHLLSNETVQNENSSSEIAMHSLLNLSVFYEKKGDSNRALFYRNRYLNLSDSLFNTREFNRVKNMQAMYEIDKINRKVDDLNAENEKNEIKIRVQTIVLYAVSTGLCLFIALLFITWIHKRKLQSAYVGLFNKNVEIMDSNRLNLSMQMEYEQRLNAEKEKIMLLTSQLAQLGHSSTESKLQHSEKSEPETSSKVSMLTCEQKAKLIRDINRIMESTMEYCDCDFSLNHLATLIGSNTKYVSTIINEVYHKNFRTYINEYRIKEACRRLMNRADYGHYTITAIAAGVGFKSPTTFISTFKKVTGMNPSTWQKIAQDKLNAL